MIPKKKGGKGPGPEKTWSSIVGEYQKWEEGDWGIAGGKSTYGKYGKGGTGNGESIRNVNKEYRKKDAMLIFLNTLSYNIIVKNEIFH